MLLRQRFQCGNFSEHNFPLLPFNHKFFCTVFLLLLYCCVCSQSPSFYHLTTANGLYDNGVRSLAIDKSGFLWVGTEESLNCHDGRISTVYLKEKFPGLPSNYISVLYADSKNRIWLGTPDGAAWMDGRRNIHRLALTDTTLQFAVSAVVETNTTGVVLLTAKGFYRFNEATEKGEYLSDASALLPAAKLKSVHAVDNSILFIANSTVALYDFTTGKKATLYTDKGLLSLCKRRNGEITIGKEDSEIITLRINGEVLKRYSLKNASSPDLNPPQPVEMVEAPNGDLIIAAHFNGLMVIKPSGQISHFLHDPINPTSLIGNNVLALVAGTNGEVVVGTATSGVSMYNIHLSQASFTGFFTSTKGEYYDSFTGSMLEDKNDVVWIGAYDRLIKWNRGTKVSSFYFFADDNKKNRGDIRALCFDNKGTLWVSIEGKGVASFSESDGFVKLNLDTSLSPAFSAGSIPCMMTDEKGMIWVCTNKGVFAFDPATRKADALPSHPLAKALAGKIVQSTFLDSKKRLWAATIYHGIYCYDKSSGRIDHFTTQQGLPSNICYAVQEDGKGRYFITSGKGLAMLAPDGRIQSLSKQTGLRYDRCESVVIDNNGIVWFSNKKCLVRLDADSKQLQFFDEKVGLLNQGFRVGSCLKAKNGELLWGGYRGISTFVPKSLRVTTLPLQVSVHSLLVGDSLMDLSSPISLPYASNSFVVGIAGIHLGIPGKTFFQYRLEGFDKEWQRGEDLSSVRYAALPPGKYTFQLKGSTDGVQWTEASQKLAIEIIPPLWTRWWFLVLAAVLFAGALYIFIQSHQKKLRQQKEELEAEAAVNYFASSMHEHQTVDAILWDVARNCIGRLRFEDCVIYLVDESRNVLVQKAAFGPKSPKRFDIKTPLVIPVGKGIVGSVAATGNPELISNTSKDPRYIVDDQHRLSEITVPLVWGGRVIGVIDCEDHRKAYFTKKHLSILITIASLCANKIVRVKAEEEKRNAELVLTDTRQKMAEAEMQALRAQMNPHFIFNCLNSINRYILKSDEATASLYLTRFAKLIRLILDNSSNKTVPLSNELEALKLYIEMEALRFDKQFEYTINVDTSVNADGIALPPLMIQPYVENAIWHGLLHKEDKGCLSISLRMLDEGMLECVIEDNGIGRAKAKEVKSKSASQRKSLGMQLTEKRLALLNQQTEMAAGITIIDKEDEQKNALGTKVILCIPV